MPNEILSSDYSGNNHRLRLAAVGAPTIDVTVHFADEASKVFSVYRDGYGFGASEMKSDCGNIYDSKDNLIGRISYNGRIWNADGKPVD